MLHRCLAFALLVASPALAQLPHDPNGWQAGGRISAQEVREVILHLNDEILALKRQVAEGGGGDCDWLRTDISIAVTPDGAAEFDTCDPDPGPFDSVLSALAWLDDKRLMPGVDVLIVLDAGEWDHRSIVVQHPDSDRFTLVGDGPRTIIRSDDSVVLRLDGRGLRTLGGMRLEGKPGATGQSGVIVERGARLDVEGSVTLANFESDALTIRTGALVTSPGGLTLADNRATGVVVQTGATAVLPDLTITNNGGAGIVVADGATLQAQDASVDGAADGVIVSDGAVANLERLEIANVRNSGLVVRRGSTARADGLSVIGAGEHCVLAENNSAVHISGTEGDRTVLRRCVSGVLADLNTSVRADLTDIGEEDMRMVERGLRVESGSSVKLNRGSTIRGTTVYAIEARSGANVQAEGAELDDGVEGLSVRYTSSVVLKDGAIDDFDGLPIQISDSSAADISGTDVEDARTTAARVVFASSLYAHQATFAAVDDSLAPLPAVLLAESSGAFMAGAVVTAFGTNASVSGNSAVRDVESELPDPDAEAAALAFCTTENPGSNVAVARRPGENGGQACAARGVNGQTQCVQAFSIQRSAPHRSVHFDRQACARVEPASTGADFACCIEP